MHPSLKRFKRLSLSCGLVLVACNVYNPSGEGETGASQEAQITEGENYFRAQDYKSATATYEAAIKSDSTNSMAYYGYAKSVMRYYQVNASSLLNEVTNSKDNGGIPFITADDWTITRYLQATSRTRLALGVMTERDSLTRWYNYTKNPTGKAAALDPLSGKRIEFMKAYWEKADKGFKGYHKKSAFPLSDLKMASNKIIADFGFVELIYAVTHLRDLNGDNTINSDDNLLKKLTFSTSGGFKVENLADIADSLDTPEKKEQFNNLIQNVASGLSSAGTVLSLIGPAFASQAGGDTSDSKGLSEKVTQNMDSVITTLGDAVTFYQFGDGKDNDGDGCIDEEIPDGKDNDNDGFTDEDARLKPLDGVDNDHNGVGKNDFVTSDPSELPNGDFKLIYTLDAGFKTKDRYRDKATRIWMQKDSVQVHFDAAGSAALMNIQYREKLDSAKQVIGGCWNNYK